MHVTNKLQEMNIYDSFYNSPDYIKDYLKNSWAHPFQKFIFPAINEERFAVLYSDVGSRPNTPTNVIIGGLVIKELFNLTDERLVANIHLNQEFQYALRLTSDEKPPISKNTFTNFRKRVFDHYEETGEDLIQKTVEELADLIAQKLEIDGQKARVDSFMVASSCRELSRIELVYSVINNFVSMLDEDYPDLIPENCEVYLSKEHEKEVIYRTKNTNTDSRLETLLEDAKLLYDKAVENGGSVTETEEFKILKRMLGEQSKDDDDSDSIEPKEGKDISPDSLQNPSDPDATYRFKGGDNIGYTANVVELFDEENSVIKNYDLKPNTYSDQKFSRDTLELLSEDESLNTNEEDDNLFELFMDGSYYVFDLARKAKKIGIEFIPTNLTGKKPATDKMSYFENFELDENLNNILCCTQGVSPYYQEKNEETNSFYAVFSKEECEGCNQIKKCRIRSNKKHNSVNFTEKDYIIGKQRKKLGDKEYIEKANQRAGIEGIPSVLRRAYNVDEMPVMGLVRQKIHFGFKIIAYNIKKLFKGIDLATT